MILSSSNVGCDRCNSTGHFQESLSPHCIFIYGIAQTCKATSTCNLMNSLASHSKMTCDWEDCVVPQLIRTGVWGKRDQTQNFINHYQRETITPNLHSRTCFCINYPIKIPHLAEQEGLRSDPDPYWNNWFNLHSQMLCMFTPKEVSNDTEFILCLWLP